MTSKVLPKALWKRLVSVVLVIIGLYVITIGFIFLSKKIGINPDDVSGANLVPSPIKVTLSVLFWGFQLIVLYLFMGYVHKNTLGNFGINKSIIKNLFAGFGVGIVFTSIITLGAYYLAYDNVNISWIVPKNVSLIQVLPYYAYFLIHLTLNSFTEEAIFRCYPIELFKNHPKYVVWVVVGASLLFAIPHFFLGGFTWIWLVFLIGYSVATSYLYFYWKSSIWLIIGFHNAANFYHFSLSGNWKLGGLFEISMDSNDQSLTIRLIYTLVIYSLFVFGVIYWGKNRYQKK